MIAARLIADSCTWELLCSCKWGSNSFEDLRILRVHSDLMCCKHDRKIIVIIITRIVAIGNRNLKNCCNHDKKNGRNHELSRINDHSLKIASTRAIQMNTASIISEGPIWVLDYRGKNFWAKVAAKEVTGNGQQGQHKNGGPKSHELKHAKAHIPSLLSGQGESDRSNADQQGIRT